VKDYSGGPRPGFVTTPQPSGTARDLGTVGAATTGIGAALMTIVGGTCCVSPIISPIIVGVLGAGGAVWAAGLKPYSWWILGVAGAFQAGSLWSVYRPRAACDIEEPPRPRRLLSRLAKGSLWLGALLWMAAVVIHVVVPA
jgi:hypothetical protein